MWKGVLRQVRDFEQTDEGIYILFRKGDSEKYDQEHLTVPELDSSFFNYSKGATHSGKAWCYVRNARRQWLRGISDSNMLLYTPFALLTQYVTNRIGLVIDETVVTDMLNPQYVTLSQAFEQISKAKSLALSPEYMVCLHPTHSTRLLLANKFSFIGEVVSPSEIIVHHSSVAQEVDDWISRNNLGVTARAAA